MQRVTIGGKPSPTWSSAAAARPSLAGCAPSLTTSAFPSNPTSRQPRTRSPSSGGWPSAAPPISGAPSKTPASRARSTPHRSASRPPAVTSSSEPVTEAGGHSSSTNSDRRSELPTERLATWIVASKLSTNVDRRSEPTETPTRLGSLRGVVGRWANITSSLSCYRLPPSTRRGVTSQRVGPCCAGTPRNDESRTWKTGGR